MSSADVSMLTAREDDPEADPLARPGPIEVFYAYAQEDEALREELDRHLAVLQQRRVIDARHAGRVGAGEDWRRAVDAWLDAAHVVLLLVSADFLASKRSWEVEIPRALARHEAGKARVIPVLLRACDWQDAPFGRLGPLPDDGRPVTSWGNRDEAWAGVARAIREAVRELSGEDEDGEDDDDLPGDDRRRHGRRGLEGRSDGFLVQVENVARLREPGALAIRRRALPPFAGLLEVDVREGALVDTRVIGAVEQTVTEDVIAQYATQLARRYRQESPPAVSTLVHGGPQVSIDLARLARRCGIVLRSFAEYQGLIDFGGYLERQTARLEVDPVYPPWLYVDQPAKWSLAGGREEQATSSALRTLWDLLEDPHPRFALVLGDFGAGKTFLLHELARRMAKENHPLVPVLVEMSRLEKRIAHPTR